MKLVWGFLGAGLIAITAVACGNDNAPSGAPPAQPPSGGGTTTTTTITITNTGVSPKSITVARGSQVTFVNSSSVPHEMDSNPHPEHTDCPEINSVGFINPGQTKLTGNLNTVRTCGYHDHNNDTNTSLQGTITIQ